MKVPPLSGILETALYVDDLEVSVAFYKKIFGFETLTQGRRLHALSVSGHEPQVLLLFKKGESGRSVETTGGVVPGSHGDGELHMAFAISAEAIDPWRRWLGQNGVTIESTVTWSGGGTSLYFRDPDNHVIELATPGTWRTY